MLPILALLLSFGFQAGGPVQWQGAVVPTTGDSLVVQLTAVCEEGWHIYATVLPREDGPLPTVFRFEPADGYVLAGAFQEPEAVEKEDPNFGMLVRYHADTVRFVQPVLRTRPEAFTLHAEVEYMVCNDQTCLPPVTVPFQLAVPARH